MPVRVLIVEDSATQAEALRAHLENHGYAATVAANAEDGLRLHGTAAFELVISDIVMPGKLDGYELCRRIKASSYDTPVVLLTSLSDPMDIIRGLECGADNFLTKPYEPAHLIERLATLLATRKIRKAGRVKAGVQVTFMGREFTISSEREQILDLLVTTFEEAVRQNRELRERERELEQARAALAQRAESLEARLESVMQSVPDVLFSVSRDWKTVYYVSPAAEVVFGCTTSEFSYEYWKRNIDQADRTTVVGALERALAGGQAETIQYRFAAPGRDPRWLLQTVVPVRSGSDVVRLDGIARDITDRVRSEEALLASEARFRRVVDSDMIGILFWDLDGEISDANDQFLRLVGYTQEDLTGGRISWRDMTPPEWKATDTRALEELATRGTCTPFEKEYIRKDGSRVPVVLGAATLEGQKEKGVAFVLDISDRKQAEAARRAASELVAATVDASPLPIIGMDPNGTVTLWNRAAEQTFGWAAREVLGRQNPTVPSTDLGTFADIRRRALQGERMMGVELRRQTRDGVLLDVRGYFAATLGSDGKPSSIIALLENISDAKKLEEQLRQAQKMEAVGRLAGGVAHDFNNLLTVILGVSELVLMDLPPDGPLPSSIQEIKGAAERAAVLTRQLLAFSRKQLVEPKVFNLNQVVSEVEKMLRRLIGEDIEVTVRLAPDLGASKSDPGQIEQVVVNLAVNARDAMRQGGRLMIETANVSLDRDYQNTHAEVQAGEYIMLTVSDSGTGMTDEVKARIFEPFFTTKEQGKGTGLGLATCYGIVKQFGGHIGVYSEVGVGTTMKVYLPRQPEAAPAERKVTAAIPRGTETILLVEDEKTVRMVAKRILESLGYRVLDAGDGPSALELLRQEGSGVALLLTDVVMPKMGGREIAEQAVQLRPGLKVLYASGYTDDVILQHRLLEHGVSIIQKPFTPETLGRKLRVVLDET